MCKISQIMSHFSLFLNRTNYICRYLGKEEQGFLQSAQCIEDDTSLVKITLFD